MFKMGGVFMVSEEVKETIYIAIGAIIAAAVLALLAFVIQLRGDFAETYNNQKLTQSATEDYMKFAGYQGEIIYGNELVALIREFWGSDTIIYIDEIVFKDKSGNVSSTYKGTMRLDETYKGDTVDETYIYLDSERMKEIDKKRTTDLENGIIKDSGTFYYDVEDLSVGRSGCIQNFYGVDFSEAYYVYLATSIYDGATLNTTKYSNSLSNYSDVTAIIVRHIPKSQDSLGKKDTGEQYLYIEGEGYKSIEGVGKMLIKDAVDKKKFGLN